MSQSKETKKIVRQAVLRCVDDFDILAVKWLWPNRIPMGMFTLLAGRPGTGKSTLAHNIMARVSNGSKWPDGPNIETPQGDCILIGEEDSVSHTIKPRLIKMGADMKNIHVWTEVEVGERIERFNLVDHLDVLEHLLTKNPTIKLVVLDTIEPFMGNTNTHRNSEVRKVLDPISALADRTGVAIIGITHLNKASKENRAAMDRVMGSVGYTGGARAVWLLAKDEDDKDLVKMVLVKTNVMGDPGGIAYKIYQVGVLDVNGEEAWTTIIKFQEGIIFEDADAIVQTPKKAPVDHVGNWLLKFLEKGPGLLSNIMREGLKAGHSRPTIYRKKEKYKIESFETKMDKMKKPLTWWKLPK